jgi:hypothetical protein
MREYNGLVYDDEMSGRLRLYILDHNGNHRGGLLFGPDVTFPDLPVASARRHAEAAMVAGREVRITNGSDHLVFHAADNKVIHPPDAEAFWRDVEKKTHAIGRH